MIGIDSYLTSVLAKLQNRVLQDLARRLAERMQTSAQLGATIHRRGDNAGKPLPFERLIEGAAKRHGLPPALIRAVIRVESNFDPQAVSHAGAKGLMQLMDDTASQLHVTNPFDPAQNIEAGVAYLKQLIQRYGSTTLGLAAYNAGPAAVDAYGSIPPFTETRVYVARVIGSMDSTHEWQA
ncbi:MAG TPA: lytic transglycosylase domain-containing protein [Anaerolineae bacterium]|nr:lytic transglycosylase domain-containing protein [Anaerolineae bacterium]